MKVKQLRAVLETLDDDANVFLATLTPPGVKDEETTPGQRLLRYLCYAKIDGEGRALTLTNCVMNKDGETLFDVPPQILVVDRSSANGMASLAAAITEDLHCQTTQAVSDYLEVTRIKDIFKQLDDLSNGKS